MDNANKEHRAKTGAGSWKTQPANNREKTDKKAVGPCQQRHLAKIAAGCWTQLANKTEPKQTDWWTQPANKTKTTHKQTGGHNQQIRQSQNTDWWM